MNKKSDSISDEDLEKKWQNLPFSNDFIFCKVMEDPALCKEALELLLGFEISRIEYPLAQKPIKNAADTRGIRLDVYAKSDSRRFDLEMQTTSNGSLLKRARYYAGCIDVDTLKPNEPFSKLSDVYIIFLCLEDPFDKGLPLYTYLTKCNECPELPNDRTARLLYNIEEYEKLDNLALKEFLKYIKTNIPNNDFTVRLSQKVEEAKQNAEYRKAYMTLEMRETERFYEGKEQKAIEDALILIKEYNASPEEAAKKMGAPLEKVLELKAQLETTN